MGNPVTDPLVLQQLNAGAAPVAPPSVVTDPAVLAQLNQSAASTNAQPHLKIGIPALDAPLDAFDDFTDQVMRRMTMGLSNKIGAIASAIMRPKDSGMTFGEAYQKELTRQHAADAAYSDQHPIASGVATGVGALASMGPQGTAFGGGSVMPQTLGQMAKQGAVMGGVSGFGNSMDQSVPQTALDTLIGTGVGAGTSTALGLAGRSLFPQTSPEVANVFEHGGQPSLGQIAGFPQSESELARFPGFSGTIDAAHKSATEGFYRASLDDALKPIGETIAKNVPAGTPAIAEAAKKVSAAYDKVIGHTDIPIDLVKDFGTARAQLLPGQHAEFDAALNQAFGGQISKAGTITGAVWKQARQNLSDLADQAAEAGGNGQFLASALEKSQSALESAIERVHPNAMADLSAANQAWRGMNVVKRAAGYMDAIKENGVFNPEQFLRAVRAKGGESAFTEGRAMMQPYAQSMYDALGNSAPVNAHEASMGAFRTLEFPFGLAARAPYAAAQGVTRFMAQPRPGILQFPNAAAVVNSMGTPAAGQAAGLLRFGQ